MEVWFWPLKDSASSSQDRSLPELTGVEAAYTVWETDSVNRV